MDITLRAATIWGRLGQLGARVRLLERAMDGHALFFGGEASEALVHVQLQLSEAVRLMGDNQRAASLAESAEAARAQLEERLGFRVREPPQLLRIAAALEALADEYN